jgi:type II restriction/modification system DNA methylase subunit YeeA
MNQAILKAYAPKARTDFIEAVSNRAASYGVSKNKFEPSKVEGDVVFISGKPFHFSIEQKRNKLIERIEKEGFDQVIEAIAYTWFNRLLAIRYLELHDYLGHGIRILSHPDNTRASAEILEKFDKAEFKSLNLEKAIELKLNGSKEAELYQMLLIAQCNELSSSMPFLFEKVDHESELLLPENLVNTDSVVRNLVNSIPEEDWRDVEIIGWLYQYYISDKKDEVIGKVVKTEDIPAATQLFTPNWIVKYMVQNTIGTKWMSFHPNSTLKSKMPYFIDGINVRDRVEIVSHELRPDEITIIDPASGSGHILVEAYNILKEIYLECGYRLRDIPRLILEKNLYGLDIDKRAAQLTAFSILMKAREDDRSIFTNAPSLNIFAIYDTSNLDKDEILSALLHSKIDLNKEEIEEIFALFEDAATLGSLISIPEKIASKVNALINLADQHLDDMVLAASINSFMPIINQMRVLQKKFDIVLANPPYLSKKGMNSQLSSWVKMNYPDTKSDLFAVFFERCFSITKKDGFLGFVSPFHWMFNGSFENFRIKLLKSFYITSLVQLEYNAFGPACVPVCSFTLSGSPILESEGTFIKLSEFTGEFNQAPKTLEAIQDTNCKWRFSASSSDFLSITGSPIAFWTSPLLRRAFKSCQPFSDFMKPRQGLATANNGKYLRRWYEVSLDQTTINGGKKWVPHSKGGTFRRWFGNNEWILNWENNGAELKKDVKAVIRNEIDFFKGGFTWSDLTSSFFNARMVPTGFSFDTTGPTAIAVEGINSKNLLAFANSKVFQSLVDVNLQGMHYSNGIVAITPVDKGIFELNVFEDELIRISKEDWDSFETSWDFKGNPLLGKKFFSHQISEAFGSFRNYWKNLALDMKQMEESNNEKFIKIYGFENEVDSKVLLSEITLNNNPNYRYGGKKNEVELANEFQKDCVKDLLSYIVGCALGRYSVESEGIQIGYPAGIKVDSDLKSAQFLPLSDNLIPVLDRAWLENDVSKIINTFIKKYFGDKYFMDNLQFIESSIGIKIEKYFQKEFYADHLKRYKKRPIYWQFSSGKYRAFQCLILMHRYNSSTLSKMRTDYVVPLLSKIVNRIDQIEGELLVEKSNSIISKLNKELDILKKQRAELHDYEEKLRHNADKKIVLNYDDGVKSNYAKFSDLLDSVNVVTGGSED